MRPLAAFVTAIFLFTGCSPSESTQPSPPPVAGTLRLEPVVTGLDRPLYLTAPAGDPRLFIVEKTGRIRIVKDGTLLPTPFLDLSDSVSGGSEQGLLSMAFHPRYATNGFFYVDFTNRTGDTRVMRYSVSTSDPDVANPASGTRAPALVGRYFYSDYCSGFLRSFAYDGHTVSEQTMWDVGDIGNVQSFGEDATGEMYIVSANSTVYRFAQQ